MSQTVCECSTDNWEYVQNMSREVLGEPICQLIDACRGVLARRSAEYQPARSPLGGSPGSGATAIGSSTEGSSASGAGSIGRVLTLCFAGAATSSATANEAGSVTPSRGGAA